MKLTDFKKRLEEELREELASPERWLYLSFADDDGFKGAVIIKAHGITDATSKCNILQINPGGQLLCSEWPENEPEPLPENTNRLLSTEDILKIWPEAKTVKEFEEAEEREKMN